MTSESLPAPELPVAIRLATPRDAEWVHAIYAPIVRDTAISFEWEVPTVAEIRRRIAAVTSTGYPWLVADAGGKVGAYAYASAFRTRTAYDWTAEVSIYVDPALTRRGIGRATYGALLRLLELQGYTSAYGVATARNPSSEGLHGAMGFERVGYLPRVGFKFGQWHDVIYWRIELGPAAEEPGPIRPVHEVIEAAGVAGAT